MKWSVSNELEQTQNPCNVLSPGQEVVAQAPRDQMAQRSKGKKMSEADKWQDTKSRF